MTSNKKEKTMLKKLEDTAPYNILYNKVSGVPEDRQENADEFKDFLCPSLGKLKSSLQITGKVDFDWLLNEYEKQGLNELPLTVVYEEKVNENETQSANLIRCPIQMTKYVKYGSHHSKIAVYLYEDNSVRVVVSTANLLNHQWNQYSHGFWVSPLCLPLPAKSRVKGDSKTKFKSTLLGYLKDYKMPDLNQWLTAIKSADFSDVKAVLITSVPGISPKFRIPNSHIKQIQNILHTNDLLNFKDEEGVWPIIAQVCSLGTFGDSKEGWLNEFFGALNLSSQSQNIEDVLQIIYPSVRNVENRARNTAVGQNVEGLKYDVKIHQSQKWIENILCVMVRRWGEQPQIRNNANLITNATQVWNDLRNTDICSNLVRSMERRCLEVIEKNGCSIKY